MKLPDLLGQFRRRLESRWQRLYRVAYAWTHDPHLAKDLVQDTMIKALRKRHQLSDQSAMDAWLFSILANTWRDYCRKNENNLDISDLPLEDPSNPEREMDQIEIINQVRSSVAKLSLAQRQIITLVDLEGFSYNEVANILNIPIGTVMSRLCRARSNLKQYLTDSELALKMPPLKSHIRRVK